MDRRSQGGFTLIEVVVVAGILAVLLAVSIAMLDGAKQRAAFGTAANEVEAAVRRARIEAVGRGVPVAFVFDTTAVANDYGGRWWVVEAAGGFDLDTFDPAAPTGVLDSGELPVSVTFGPAGGYGQALPAPFSGIPTVSGLSPNFLYCSFCATGGTNPNFGSVLFQPRGAPTFSGGPSTVGQQFTLTGAVENEPRTRAVAILGTTGTLQVFED